MQNSRLTACTVKSEPMRDDFVAAVLVPERHFMLKWDKDNDKIETFQ